MLAEEPLTDGQRALVEQALSETEKLGFLIDSLVKTSRLESGMVQVSPIYSPLSDLLHHLEDSFAPEAQRNNIDFTVEFSDIYAVFDPK